MTTYNLIAKAPTSVIMTMAANTALFPSPLIASATTLNRGAAKWRVVYAYSNLINIDRAALMALLVKLKGQANRVRVPVYDNPKQGAYGGTPLVAGASQTGTSINLDGCSATVTGWIKAGDYFSIDVNGEHELKMATADASSDGGGAITIDFLPALRASPLDNAAVYVEDGVLSKPQGVFMLSSPAPSWQSTPANNEYVGGTSTFSLDMVEAVFATQ